MKNVFAKRVKPDEAYAVYGNDPRLPDWTWYVLKMYQAPENAAKNKYARAFCLVKTPIVPNGEYGDTYLSDIGGHLLKGADVRGPEHQLINLQGGFDVD